jgi:lactoylglutathione lyase
VLLASAAVAAVWLTFVRLTSRTQIKLPAAPWTAAASSGVPAIDDALRNRPPPPRNALRWSWQQTMLRVKDPTRSLGFYRGLLGFTLLDRMDFPALRFSLYFLATLPPDEPYTLTPGTDEAHRFLWTFKGVTLELTHNWGTELRPDFGYHPGNAPGDGFGHVAVSCEDVEARCTELEAAGVRFQKKPNEGRMKGLAFALDPDGYWVEVVRRPPNTNAGKYAFAQTMLRVRDPRLTIPFYERLGLSLVLARHLGNFSLYFMANLPPDGPPPPDPYGDDAPAFVASLPGPVLEFTHNHGTEDQEGFVHDNGNTRGRQGFGHVGFLVDDVGLAVLQLDPLGYGFVKRPEDGTMKGLAFAKDPDGYWVEIIRRGGYDAAATPYWLDPPPSAHLPS